MSIQWTPAEKELAVANRADKSIKEITQVLEANGFKKTPKAIEKFFERLGLTKEKARITPKNETKAGPKASYVDMDLKTTWGDEFYVKNLKIEFGKASKVAPIAIIPDIHAPFHDEKAIELACKALEIIRPVALVYLGDNIDWAQLSSFDKDPERITSSQKEVDKFHEIDKMFVDAIGKDARRYWLIGNHEERLNRYLCSHPEISGLRGMQLSSVLGLDKKFKQLQNLQIIEEEINWRDRFIFKHGSAVRQYSGVTARAELDKEHINGISGHTHRAGAYYLTHRGRMLTWFEGGCLCQLEPTYMKNPNWQHAISIGYFNADGSSDYFHIDQIIFSKYQAVVNGNYIRVD